MRTAWQALAIGLVLWSGACGGGNNGVVAVSGKGGSSGSSGTSGSGAKLSTPKRMDAGTDAMTAKGSRDAASPSTDAGRDAGDAAMMPPEGAPVIKILEPSAASDPNSDTVLTTSTVEVHCQVTRAPIAGARDVNQSSIRIGLVNMKDHTMSTAGVLNALPDNIFAASFNVADLPNGPIRFVCEASDVGMPALKATETLDTLLDLGPTVTILEPKDNGIQAPQTPALIKFTVQPAPLSADDKEADPSAIKLSVLGRSFHFTEDPHQPGLYTTNVDFADKTLFKMTPSGGAIVVSASSSRTPDAPTRSQSVDLTIDETGPSISVNSPAKDAIVRGLVTLSLTIRDPSKVALSSVVGSIQMMAGQPPFTLTDWKVSGDTYTADFDTRAFGSELTQLTINITASDTVGNPYTIDLPLKLDNVPPLVSLDPPMIREFKDSGSNHICSDPFDPVGEDAMSDKGIALASSLYRVLVFERTNGSPGANYHFVAGVDGSSVILYVQNDTSVPLLIDTDNDAGHVCDEINTMPATPAPRPVQLGLSPVTPRGTAYYPATANFSDPANVPSNVVGNPICTAGSDGSAPAPLCGVTNMTRVITQPLDGAPPAIYSFTPTNSDKGPCEGLTWELLPTIVTEGWHCLAARALDNIGNVGVSPPIRVCFDDGVGPTPCHPSTDTLPTCTDGCALPDDLPRDLVYKAQ
jgi:hypothetical protein